MLRISPVWVLLPIGVIFAIVFFGSPKRMRFAKATLDALSVRRSLGGGDLPSLKLRRGEARLRPQADFGEVKQS